MNGLELPAVTWYVQVFRRVPLLINYVLRPQSSQFVPLFMNNYTHSQRFVKRGYVGLQHAIEFTCIVLIFK